MQAPRASNPRPITAARVVDAVASRARYYFIRPILGAVPRWVYGNDAGLYWNVSGRLVLGRCRRAYGEPVRMQDSRAEAFRRDGFLRFDPQFPAGVMGALVRRYQGLIDDDEKSVFNGIGKYRHTARALRDPLKDVPQIRALLTPTVQGLVEDYYGSYFRVGHVRAWRTYAVPGLSTNAEAYSNQWHNDHEPVYMLRFLVYLSDHVTRETGAFRVHSIASTRDIMRSGFIRRDRIVGAAKDKIEDERRVTYVEGDAGAACLCNVQMCLHRAGVPHEGSSRDILQLTVLPADTPFVNWDGVGSG